MVHAIHTHRQVKLPLFIHKLIWEFKWSVWITWFLYSVARSWNDKVSFHYFTAISQLLVFSTAVALTTLSRGLNGVRSSVVDEWDEGCQTNSGVRVCVMNVMILHQRQWKDVQNDFADKGGTERKKSMMWVKSLYACVWVQSPHDGVNGSCRGSKVLI